MLFKPDINWALSPPARTAELWNLMGCFLVVVPVAKRGEVRVRSVYVAAFESPFITALQVYVDRKKPYIA